jgi:hypothetical protein
MKIPDFHSISIALIVAVTLAGGYYPLFGRSSVRDGPGMPLGQAFAAGVFLALALLAMGPSQPGAGSMPTEKRRIHPRRCPSS